jgi:tripartite-type tricarboxylate transporter receptor subunit TctC
MRLIRGSIHPGAVRNRHVPAAVRTIGHAGLAAARRRLGRIVPLLALLAVSPGARADLYPARALRLIVPFATGGLIDLAARVTAEHLSGALGQPVVIENRPGASGNTGTALVAQSRPDGYTLGFVSDSVLAINPHVYRRMPFNALEDLAPLGAVGSSAQVLVVSPGLPAADLPGFIAIAQAHPGRLTYGSAGSGSTMHLGAFLFAAQAGIVLTHVPYKGAGPAIIDLMAGRIDLISATLGSVIQQVRAGSLRVLAVSGTERMKALPQVPSTAESGLPNYRSALWLGVVAARDTPAQIVSQLNAALRAIPDDPVALRRLEEVFMEPMPLTAQAFAERIRSDWQRWGPVVEAAGVSLD